MVLLHNCFPQAAQAPVGVVVLSIDLCGKILRNLICMEVGVPLIGSYSSYMCITLSKKYFGLIYLVCSCCFLFFLKVWQKEIDKIPSDWENSSKYTESK